LTVFAGIRNDITSIQAIFRLIDMGISVYLVDTGSGNTVYHPKLYFFEYDNCYTIIIGSANLTGGGINSNIEFSSIIEMDKENVEVNKLLSCIQQLPQNYNNNIFKITTKKEAFSFYKKGLLTDERITINVSGGLKNRSKNLSDKTPRINLKNRKHTSSIKNPDKKIKSLIHSIDKTITQWILVWESTELKERDLNIPSGAGTNPTGSMLFKKGNFDNIDQRIYFRNEVFSDLNWVRDQDRRTAHLERASADFQLEIRGINYGIYKLKLSHNTDVNSESYRQNNSMTQVHWGIEAKKLIAHRELLGERMELYRSVGNPPVFRIKIG
jgi:hypothetical protein